MEGAMATNIKHLIIVQEKAFKQKQGMSKNQRELKKWEAQATKE
jgi:hypothetical protein